MSISKQERDAVIGLLPFLPKNPVVFDVGSNKGLWSDIIMEEFGQECDIHFFEPNEIMLNYTRIKYDYNKNITYNNVAIRDNSGTGIFYYFENENNGLSSLLYNKQWEDLPMKRGMTICLTIHAYCESKGIKEIDFLKIDCEGGDFDALISCYDLFSSGKIRFIQIEYGEHWKLANHTMLELRNRIAYYNHSYKTSYKMYRFTGINFEEVISFTEDYAAENYIITQHNIINHSQGWNKVFIENTKDIKAGFVLEIGSCEGLTAKHICENMLKPGGRMICVDPLRDYYIKPDDMPELVDQYQRWQRNTKGLPINLYRKKFEDAYDELKDFRFDLIYCDGDHSEEAVYFDCKKSLPLIKSGGYLVIDDYDLWSEGTKRGIDKFISESAVYIRSITKNYQVVIKVI